MTLTQTLKSEWGREPLRVDALVPTVMLRSHLAHVHVGTPDEDVIAETRAEIERVRSTDDRWTDEIVEQTIAAALWIHHEHRAKHRNVMSGLAETIEGGSDESDDLAHRH